MPLGPTEILCIKFPETTVSKEMVPPLAPMEPPPAAPATDLVAQLAQLAQLKEAGALTDDEFQIAKVKLPGTVDAVE